MSKTDRLNPAYRSSPNAKFVAGHGSTGDGFVRLDNQARRGGRDDVTGFALRRCCWGRRFQQSAGAATSKSIAANLPPMLPSSIKAVFMFTS